MLRTIAERNPVTSMSEALHRLFGNPSGDFGSDPAWSLQHPVSYTVIWITGIVAVCASLAIRAYQRSVAG